MSIIKHLKGLSDTSVTLLLFYGQQQSYTSVFYPEIDLGLSSLSSVTMYYCTVCDSQNTRFQQCVENMLFLPLLQINTRGHRKCISLEKLGPPDPIKLEFLISSTSFPSTVVNKMSHHEKPVKWRSHQSIHINSYLENEKPFFLLFLHLDQ